MSSFTASLVLTALAMVNALALPSSKLSVVHPSIRIEFADGSNLTSVLDQPKISRETADEICTTGVWILYLGYNYTSNERPSNGGFTKIVPSMESCTTFNPIGSARPAGSRQDNSVPSVTVFDEDGFSGEALIFENKISNISIKVSSIVTINTQVEFFSHTNFEGDSFCVTGENIDGCVGGVCWGSALYDLPWDVKLAKSAKMGCSSTARRFQSKKNTNHGKTIMVKEAYLSK